MIPKYRMWNRITSALHHVEGLYFDNKEVQYIDEVGILRFIKFENTILMQSTGLKDKNGKEIFEGDVVKMAKDVYSDPTYYEVIRHRGGAYRLESNQHGCELWLRHTNCEVIGNIYENPELLEEEA
ncbi:MULTISPECIES: YopX family protein [unclassified Streptococcus]|uniref:YopX family protein n=1 Tax=unclassified Streptococcus TaxID=2608887 RepID=UPI00193103E8|nr:MULTISPECIES: YopX family protein [unclassified Streptococcus]